MMQKSINIITPGDFFLYLPLYWAEKYYFDELVENSKYKVNIRPSPDEGFNTDEKIFERMMESQNYHDDILCVCDPSVIIGASLRQQKQPVLLAGLITNAAFWAVNHNSEGVSSLKDLGRYDKIIAYERGTTSYSIARRILRMSKPDSIEENVIESGIDSAMPLLMRRQNKSVLLTPQVNEIANSIIHNKNLHVELPIGKTDEYNNVLVTGLISRNDVIEIHSGVIKNILQSIQKSVLEIKSILESDCKSDRFKRLSKFVRDRYEINEKAVTEALNLASESNVFPLTIVPNAHDWENAIKASYESDPQQFRTRLLGNNRSGITETENPGSIDLDAPSFSSEEDQGAPDVAKLIADNQYEERIRPYEHLAEEALQTELLERFKNRVEKRNSSVSELNRFTLFVGLGAGMGIVLTVVSGWRYAIISIVLSVMGVTVDYFAKLEASHDARRIFFWILVLIATLFTFSYPHLPSALQGWSTIIAVMLALLISALEAIFQR